MSLVRRVIVKELFSLFIFQIIPNDANMFWTQEAVTARHLGQARDTILIETVVSVRNSNTMAVSAT